LAKKLTYDAIKEYINNKETGNKCNLQITEEEFEQEKIKQNKNNSHVLLNLKCGCGKPFKKNWNKFYSRNQRTCNECSNKLSGEKHRIPYKEIKHYIEIESNSGCELLTTEDEYINTHLNINIKCKCGNPFTTAFHQFKGELYKKQHCDECGNKATGLKLSKPYSEVKNIIANNGCELLTTIENYENSSSLLEIKCNCGKPFKTTHKTFSRKTNPKNKCDDCANEIGNTKRMDTLYQNGTTRCSSQQSYVHSVLGGYLNYPVKTSSLDIAFLDEKIYLECDFSGHWMPITLGNMTKEKFDQRELRRWYALNNSNWREIRIISRHDLIPSDQKLLEILSYARTYLNQNHHYIKFDIDNSKIINSQGQFDYDFGELRKIKPTDIQVQEAI
jgi:ribosomal protein L34E